MGNTSWPISEREDPDTQASQPIRAPFELPRRAPSDGLDGACLSGVPAWSPPSGLLEEGSASEETKAVGSSPLSLFFVFFHSSTEREGLYHPPPFPFPSSPVGTKRKKSVNIFPLSLLSLQWTEESEESLFPPSFLRCCRMACSASGQEVLESEEEDQDLYSEDWAAFPDYCQKVKFLKRHLEVCNRCRSII